MSELGFEKIFEHAFDEVSVICSIDELEKYLKRILDPYGLENAVYHAVKIPGRDRLNSVLALTYPLDWVKHYISEDYFQIDPVVIAARTTLLPIDWEHLDKTSLRARKMFNEARDAGVGRRGLSLPIRGSNGDTALFSITGNWNDKDWAALKRGYMRDFQIIAHFIHSKVMEILGADDAVSAIKLSPRERECLQWAAMGKTSDDIAMILKITERSVRFFLEGARHKLGCVNKTQAAAKAASLRLISL